MPQRRSRPPDRRFRTGRKCVETSDFVIEKYFISTLDSRILDFSPMPLGAAESNGIGKSPDGKRSDTYDLGPTAEGGPGSENPVAECRTLSVCHQGT